MLKFKDLEFIDDKARKIVEKICPDALDYSETINILNLADCSVGSNQVVIPGHEFDLREANTEIICLVNVKLDKQIVIHGAMAEVYSKINDGELSYIIIREEENNDLFLLEF